MLSACSREETVCRLAFFVLFSTLAMEVASLTQFVLERRLLLSRVAPSLVVLRDVYYFLKRISL
jgi:hypothetical protein